jgi:hypothetical protein
MLSSADNLTNHSTPFFIFSISKKLKFILFENNLAYFINNFASSFQTNLRLTITQNELQFQE